jgi:hypothetical protein
VEAQYLVGIEKPTVTPEVKFNHSETSTTGSCVVSVLVTGEPVMNINFNLFHILPFF